ncbi:hypothetical protein FACS189483_06750 [Spirochaetia bacterium]|nr:hypothetical protein FACS189483_06750 [Spirochaetia bacterium]
MKYAVLVLAIVLALLLGSCATVGQLRPVSDGYEVIGTVQTIFTARDSWLKKNEIINTQAYIKLLEAAAQKHTGENDVCDIIWASGRYLGGVNIEVSATGKVVRANATEGQLR